MAHMIPLPTEETFDRGSKLIGDFSTTAFNAYGLKRSVTTLQLPEVNAFIEWIQQIIGNTNRTFDIYNNEDIFLEDTRSGMLGATIFTLRATYHTTVKATLSLEEMLFLVLSLK
jgi:hypothetical protein